MCCLFCCFFISFLILGVVASDLWNFGIREMQCSSNLTSLAQGLPDVLLASNAPVTLDKYCSAWIGWKRWAYTFPCIDVFPAKPFLVALYLKDLHSSASSVVPITSAMYGIQWAHQVGAQPFPTDHDFVKSTLEGRKRLGLAGEAQRSRSSGSFSKACRSVWWSTSPH